MEKTLLVLTSFFLVVIFLLTGCISSEEGSMPQIPEFVNKNEEFGVNINYYKVEEEFQNFLKGFGIAD
jgi:hypothetical protein